MFEIRIPLKLISIDYPNENKSFDVAECKFSRANSDGYGTDPTTFAKIRAIYCYVVNFLCILTGMYKYLLIFG